MVLLLGVVHLLVVLSPCGRLWQRLPPTPPALLPPCGASSLRRKPSSPPKYTCLSKFSLIRYALSSKKQKEIVATSTTTHQAPSLLVPGWRLTRLTISSAYKSSHQLPLPDGKLSKAQISTIKHPKLPTPGELHHYCPVQSGA